MERTRFTSKSLVPNAYGDAQMIASAEMKPNTAPDVPSALGKVADYLETPTAWWIALSLMLMGLLLPLLLVEVPPLTDYPNHLARGLFLAFGADDPATSRMFARNWQIAPNLALDMILPPLLFIMSPLIAGKVLLAIAAILPATGAIALNQACFQRRSLWALGVGLVVYNIPFLLGFINFQLGVGVALWGAAAWIAIGPERPLVRIATGAVFALVAFFSHLFSFAFFGVLIGCAEAAAIYQRGFTSSATLTFAIKRLSAVAGALILPAVLYVVSPLASTGGYVFRNSWVEKIKTLAVPVGGYAPKQTYIILAALALILAILIIKRRLRVAPLVFFALPLLAVVFLLLPTGAKGVFYIDTRIPVMMGFLLFAATMPRKSQSLELGIYLVLTALFVARITLISQNWLSAQSDIQQVRLAMATVTPGSRVLAVDTLSRDAEQEPVRFRVMARSYPGNYWHYASFAYIDHHAFWADAFTLYGQQPVVALPPYNPSSNPGGFPIQNYGLLADPTATGQTKRPSYLTAWPSKFDYILVMNADRDKTLERFLPGKLSFVSRQGFAVLLKVRR